MKLVFVSFFEGKTDEVLELIESEHVKSYTHWPVTRGKADGFRPRMGTQIWSGNNSAVLFPIDDERIDFLIEKIEQFNRETEYEGISAFVLNVERMSQKIP